MMGDSKADLQQTVAAVRDAVSLLSAARPTMERFLQECRDMESVGAVLRPELFMDPKRRRLSDAIKPLFQAAIVLVETHQMAALALMEATVAEQMRKGDRP